jgi:hypothetical protein
MRLAGRPISNVRNPCFGRSADEASIGKSKIVRFVYTFFSRDAAPQEGIENRVSYNAYA